MRSPDSRPQTCTAQPQDRTQSPARQSSVKPQDHKHRRAQFSFKTDLAQLPSSAGSGLKTTNTDMLSSASKLHSPSCPTMQSQGSKSQVKTCTAQPQDCTHAAAANADKDMHSSASRPHTITSLTRQRQASRQQTKTYTVQPQDCTRPAALQCRVRTHDHNQRLAQLGLKSARTQLPVNAESRKDMQSSASRLHTRSCNPIRSQDPRPHTKTCTAQPQDHTKSPALQCSVKPQDNTQRHAQFNLNAVNAELPSDAGSELKTMNGDLLRVARTQLPFHAGSGLKTASKDMHNSASRLCTHSCQPMRTQHSLSHPKTWTAQPQDCTQSSALQCLKPTNEDMHSSVSTLYSLSWPPMLGQDSRPQTQTCSAQPQDCTYSGALQCRVRTHIHK